MTIGIIASFLTFFGFQNSAILLFSLDLILYLATSIILLKIVTSKMIQFFSFINFDIGSINTNTKQINSKSQTRMSKGIRKNVGTKSNTDSVLALSPVGGTSGTESRSSADGNSSGKEELEDKTNTDGDPYCAPECVINNNNEFGISMVEVMIRLIVVYSMALISTVIVLLMLVILTVLFYNNSYNVVSIINVFHRLFYFTEQIVNCI